jgi:hypothetical protein
MWRKLCDRLSVWLLLGGHDSLAMLLSRWRTRDGVHLLPAAPEPVPVPPEVLRVIDFDPRWNYNVADIDASKDIAWPTTKYDVN